MQSYGPRDMKCKKLKSRKTWQHQCKQRMTYNDVTHNGANHLSYHWVCYELRRLNHGPWLAKSATLSVITKIIIFKIFFLQCGVASSNFVQRRHHRSVQHKGGERSDAVKQCFTSRESTCLWKGCGQQSFALNFAQKFFRKGFKMLREID